MAQNEIPIFRLNRKPTGEKGVTSTLDDQRRRVFRSQDLQTLFHQHREEWGIRSTVSWKSFLVFLQTALDLKEIVLKASNHETMLRRYLWRKPTALEVAAGMRSTAYLCHSSAVLLHSLNDQLLRRVLYVNYEQSKKPRPEGELTQVGLDRAFRGKQRESTFAFQYENHEIIVLSGKHTNNLEVQGYPITADFKVNATSIERTLIDIAVRPTYAGGVHQVLSAYRGAKGRVSVPKLMKTLQRLDHVYPYHQAIGFYLKRAEYPEVEYRELKKLGMEFNFYLAHGMSSKTLDNEWRIYHPMEM